MHKTFTSGETRCEADRRVKNEDQFKETKVNRRQGCQLNGIRIDDALRDELFAVPAAKLPNGTLDGGNSGR